MLHFSVGTCHTFPCRLHFNQVKHTPQTNDWKVNVVVNMFSAHMCALWLVSEPESPFVCVCLSIKRMAEQFRMQNVEKKAAFAVWFRFDSTCVLFSTFWFRFSYVHFIFTLWHIMESRLICVFLERPHECISLLLM